MVSMIASVVTGDTRLTINDADVSLPWWVEGWRETSFARLHKQASERCPPPLGGLFMYESICSYLY